MGNPSVNTSRIEHPPDKPLPSEAAQRAARLAGSRVVIVCGGRGYAGRNELFHALDRAQVRSPITLLVHGASMERSTGRLLGADALADEWARDRGVRIELHPADWLTWGDEAETVRWRQMARAGAHGVIALPGFPVVLVGEAEIEGIAVWRPFV